MSCVILYPVAKCCVPFGVSCIAIEVQHTTFNMAQSGFPMCIPVLETTKMFFYNFWSTGTYYLYATISCSSRVTNES